MQSVFADEVLSMVLTPEGVVRMELGVRALAAGNSQAPGTEVHTVLQLALSLPGFLKAFEGQEKIMRKLMADGLVQKRPAEVADGSTTTPPEA